MSIKLMSCDNCKIPTASSSDKEVSSYPIPLDENPVVPLSKVTEAYASAPVAEPSNEGPQTCLNRTKVSSSGTFGATVPTSLLNARDVRPGEGVTLFARAGRQIVRFVGNGILQFKDGAATLVENIVVKVQNYWGTPGNKPRPWAYEAVVDADGETFGVRGLEDADSVKFWDASDKLWKIVDVADLPKRVRGVTSVSAGEILVAPKGDGCGGTRPVRKLCGDGVVVVRNCGDQCIAEVVPVNKLGELSVDPKPQFTPEQVAILNRLITDYKTETDCDDCAMQELNQCLTSNS